VDFCNNSYNRFIQHISKIKCCNNNGFWQNWRILEPKVRIKPEGLWRWRIAKITELLDIVHRPSLIKTRRFGD
jgi:hypothetical protein